MQMVEQFDISTLAWVKGEIDETLKQARIALETYDEDPDDASQLEFCIGYVHQVYGTLKMVELSGAALFAEEIEKFAVALRDGQLSQPQTGMELLMRAILQLPDYLESMLSGQKDNPVTLLPLLNELRSLRGEVALGGEHYFNPELNVEPPENNRPAPAGMDMRVLAKKLHRYVLVALSKLIKGLDIGVNLRTLATVLEKLDAASEQSDSRRLLWVAAAFIESLRDGGLELHKETKQLLGKLEQAIRRLAAGGEDGVRGEQDRLLLRALLYQLSHSTAAGDKTLEVQRAFSLMSIADESELGGMNAELKQTVSADLMEELTQIKDVFDIFVRSDRTDGSGLESMAGSLRRISDTLSLLQEEQLCAALKGQVGVVEKLISGELEAEDGVLMGVAGAILSVESALRDWGVVAPVEKADAQEEQVSDTENAPEAAAEHQRVTRQVMKEARDDLIKVREAVSGFLISPEDKSALDGVSTRMHQVIGSLNLLSYRRVAQVLGACQRFIEERLIDADALPDERQLDALADAVMSIEYYMEAFVQSRVHPGSVLEVAESAVGLLGYSMPASDETFIEETVSEEAVSEETVSEEAVSEETVSEEAVSEEAVSEEAVSEEAVSEEVSEPGLDVDEEILEIFIEEAEEELERIGDLLPKWSADASDEESLKEMRRAFHTLKGSGRLVGAAVVGEFAWAFENMLNRVIDGTLNRNAALLDMLEQASEILPELIERFKKGNNASHTDADMLQAMAHDMVQPGGVKLEQIASHPEVQLPETEEPSEGESVPEAEVEEEQEAVSIDEVPDLDPILLDIYAKEARGHLSVIHEYLQQIDEGGSHKMPEPVTRALHTLKGSSTMAGINGVAAVSAALEKYGKTLQGLHHSISDDGVSALRACYNYIGEMLDFLLDRSLPQPNRAVAQQLADEAYEAVAHLEHLADAAPEAGLASVQEEPEQSEISHEEEKGLASIVDLALDAADLSESEKEVDDVPSDIAVDESVAEQEEIDTPTAVVEEYDEELLEIFLEEGVDILDASEQTLQDWVDNPDDKTLVEALQRQLHTLKGGARMAGIRQVGDLSHSLESVFDKLVDGVMERSPQMMDLLQLSHDRLVIMLEQVRNHEPISSGDDLIQQVEHLAAGGDLETITTEMEELQPETEVETETQSEVIEPSAVLSEEYREAESFAPTALDQLLERFAECQIGWQRDIKDSLLFSALQASASELETEIVNGGIEPLQPIIAAVQSLLAAMADGHVTVSEKQGDLFTLAVERIRAIAMQHREQQPMDDGLFLVNTIRDLIAEGLLLEQGQGALSTEQGSDDEVSAKQEEVTEEKRQRGPRIQHEVVRVRADLLDDLVNYAGEVSIYRSRVEQQIASFGSNLEEMVQTIGRLREQLRQVEIETEAQIDSRRAEAQKQGYDDFDPLEFDRFTNMQTLSRSMAESLNDLLSVEDMLSSLSRETETLLLQQSRVNTELQESLMHTRMVPMSESASRLRRVVRQTASELGKRTTLAFKGADVEMDRNVVERMMAPLEHMLRNSIAHGIEEKAQRKQAGKPEEGTITIALVREGSEIVIRISDDGGGINLEAVKQKAIDRGLMQPGAQLSDQEIMQFILESGFSTAATLSQVAGRGVGMDVVNSEIKQLGGILEIDSSYGEGTTFTVRLPLTLSVSRALLVQVAEDVYAIPLHGISGIERIAGAELSNILGTERPHYRWLEDEFDVMHLTEALGAGSGVLFSEGKQPLLLSSSGGHHVAFAVDGLLGSREIVVKSLGSQLSALPNLAGATILADGSVALIIDMPALVRRGMARIGAESGDGALQSATQSADREPVVMVVDDSITVRKVTERLLKRHNIKCVVAKDGVDAIGVLDEVIPDVMLLDIEMPRMDGFELATHIRNSERLKHIPIIMITSRTGEKHRQRAFDIGVNEYMGKPYTEADLLENIEKQLQEANA